MCSVTLQQPNGEEGAIHSESGDDCPRVSSEGKAAGEYCLRAESAGVLAKMHRGGAFPKI